jgi:hypothetical protein
MWNRHWQDCQYFPVYSDEPGDGGGGGGGGGDHETVEYLKAEAKKAFEKRDALAKQLRDMQALVLSESDRADFEALKAGRADIDEKKKRAEGQFDTLKTELVTKHEAERKAQADELDKLRTYITQTEIDRAFSSATALFGGADALTVLPADIAAAYFRSSVEVTDVQGQKRVIVKRANGDTIHGADGNPAPFELAMREMIQGLPESMKDRILRGSGKAGSGSSDGSKGTPKAVDLTRLTADSFKDPKVRQALKDRQVAAGGMVMGRAFERVSK